MFVRQWVTFLPYWSTAQSVWRDQVCELLVNSSKYGHGYGWKADESYKVSSRIHSESRYTEDQNRGHSKVRLNIRVESKADIWRWAGNRITEILGFEDEVLIDICKQELDKRYVCLFSAGSTLLTTSSQTSKHFRYNCKRFLPKMDRHSRKNYGNIVWALKQVQLVYHLKWLKRRNKN